MSLLSLLTQSMSSQSSVNSLSKKTGVSDAAVKMLIAAAVPMLLKSLTKNAASKDGASSLLGALTQHTSTKALPDQIAEADAEDGGKIIGHIFGDKKNDALNQLSQQTGLDTNQVNSLLGNMAPALLSSLSAATTQTQQTQQTQQLNSAPASSGGLGGLLSGLFGGGSSNTNSAPAAGADLFGSILGGGASSGGDLLSSLFGCGSDDSSDDDGSSLLNSLLGLKF